MVTYEITDAHVAKFKKFCEMYINKFGLFEWERYYKRTEQEGNVAACGCDRDGRLAILMIAEEWDDMKPTEQELRMAAKHEVLELLLWDLCDVLSRPGAPQEEINATRHAVIRRLEQVIT